MEITNNFSFNLKKVRSTTLIDVLRSYLSSMSNYTDYDVSVAIREHKEKPDSE